MKSKYHYTLFYKQHFYKQRQTEIGENQANAKQDPEAELLLFENYSHYSSTLSSKNNSTYSINQQKNKSVCFHEIIRLIITKMEMKMKNRSHRCDISRPRSRHGHKYTKHKVCLSIMMVICIKQHQSNI